jgi:hypothetical protein
MFSSLLTFSSPTSTHKSNGFSAHRTGPKVLKIAQDILRSNCSAMATKSGCTSDLKKKTILRSFSLRTRHPGVDTMAADGDGRRIRFVSIPRHTLILLARASAQYSLPRPRDGNFAHASRSDGPRNLLELQALHPAQPSALVLYCSDFMLTIFHTGSVKDEDIFSDLFCLVYFCLVLSKTTAATSSGHPSTHHVCSTACLAARPHALRPCARQPRGCHCNWL